LFIQVIKVPVSDRDGWKAALDGWITEVGPGATGWLGSTGGVTDDGLAVLTARYETKAQADANRDRPEHVGWLERSAKYVSGEAVVKDSTSVWVDLVGDPDTAEFVQVIEGRVSDTERMMEIGDRDRAAWGRFRPEILGSVAVVHEGGEYTMFLYFTNEPDAREGEKKPIPPELADQAAEMNSLDVGEPTFYDLRAPHMVTSQLRAS
jgi:hypothetical protein